MDFTGKEHDVAGEKSGVYPNDDPGLIVQLVNTDNEVAAFLKRLEEYRQELVLDGENEDTEDLLYQLLETIAGAARIGKMYRQLNRDFRDINS